MRIDIGFNEYHKTDDHAVFTSEIGNDCIWSASRTYKNGYDCSESCEVTLTKKEVCGILKVAKAKGWV